jgi:hypothetical protein
MFRAYWVRVLFSVFMVLPPGRQHKAAPDSGQGKTTAASKKDRGVRRADRGNEIRKKTTGT